jgi:adenylate cyclase
MVAGIAARWGMALVIVSLCIGLSRTAPAERLQLQWLDTSFQLLRGTGEEHATAQVAIVGIDQASISASGKPFALMLDEFALALEGLRVGRSAAVGIDLLFPAAAFETLVPGAAKRLALAIGRLRTAAPFVLGRLNGEQPAGDAGSLYAAMAGAGGEGLLLVPTDRDGSLRRIEPVHGRDDLLLAPRLAARLGSQPAAGIVDFSIGPRFDYTALHTVVKLVQEGDASALRQRFEGKVVLVGAVLPDQDRQRLPLPMAAWEEGTVSAGVVFQAQALRSLLQDRMIHVLPWATDGVALAIIVLLWRWRPRPQCAAIAAFVLTLAILGASLCLLKASMYMTVMSPLLALLLGLGTLNAEAYVRELAEQRRLRSIFAGYVSPAILETILSGALRDGLTGRRHQLAFLFADIRGFTAFCAQTPPEGVIAFLNRYYTAITGALHHHGGTIDKFSGDGIMVFFGAPQASANPCRDAVSAALAVLDALTTLNQELPEEGLPPVEVGIGIAYGDAVLGNVGSQLRHDYTATGAATTRAAHIQQYTKQVRHTLLVEQAAFALADMPEALGKRFEAIEAELEKHGKLTLVGFIQEAEEHA